MTIHSYREPLATRRIKAFATRGLPQTSAFCLLLASPGFAADSGFARMAQANGCAIYGSGFVATTDGGCARIGGRVRVQRRQERALEQRAPVVATPQPAPMGTPVANGFHFLNRNSDGASRAHLRVPNDTSHVFAPAFR